MSRRRKMGGNQLGSRRGKAQSLLNKGVLLIVTHRDLTNPIFLEGILVKDGEDGPYMLSGTEAKIPLQHARIDFYDKRIELNLNGCTTAGYDLRKYQIAGGRH